MTGARLIAPAMAAAARWLEPARTPSVWGQRGQARRRCSEGTKRGTLAAKLALALRVCFVSAAGKLIHGGVPLVAEVLVNADLGSVVAVNGHAL